MTFEEAMREIESDEFAARVNVASDLRTFLRTGQSETAVQILLNELESAEKRQRLFDRIIRLSQQSIDPRYENPSDTALAIYLHALSLKDTYAAKLAVGFVLQTPRCWWADKLAQLVLRDSLIRSSALSVKKENVLVTSSVSAQIIFSTDSEEGILPLTFPSMPGLQFSVKVTPTGAPAIEPVPSAWELGQLQIGVSFRNLDKKPDFWEMSPL